MRTVKFNLKAALANPERVVYRNGEKPKEWHWFKTAKALYPVVSVNKEGKFYTHRIDGAKDFINTDKDLLLLSEPKVKPTI